MHPRVLTVPLALMWVLIPKVCQGWMPRNFVVRQAPGAAVQHILSFPNPPRGPQKQLKMVKVAHDALIAFVAAKAHARLCIHLQGAVLGYVLRTRTWQFVHCSMQIISSALDSHIPLPDKQIIHADAPATGMSQNISCQAN